MRLEVHFNDLLLKRYDYEKVFSYGKVVTYMNDGTSLNSVRQIRQEVSTILSLILFDLFWYCGDC